MGMERSDEGEKNHITCGSIVYSYADWGVAMNRIHIWRLAVAVLEGKSSTSSDEFWGHPKGVSSQSSSKMPTVCLALAM